MPLDRQDFGNMLLESQGPADTQHRRSKEAFKFESGDQWDAADRAKLRSEERACLVFNRCQPIISAVSGSEMVNRFETSFLPRSADLNDIDVQAAEALGEIYLHLYQQADMEQHISAAFHDAIVGGMGWTETYVDFYEHPDGRVVTRHVPVYEMAWDPNARHGNLLDARYIIRGRWMPRNEFERDFPESAEDAMGSIRSDQDFPGGHMGRSVSEGMDYDHPVNKDIQGTYYDSRRGLILVYEAQYYEDQPDWWRVMIPGPMGQLYPQGINLPDRNDIVYPGQKLWVAGENFDEVITDLIAMSGPLALPAEEFIYSQQPRRVWYRSFMSGGEVLGREKLPSRASTYGCITGLRDESNEEHVEWHGIVRDMIDPQKLVNKSLSAIVTLLATNPNALIYEDWVFENEEEAMRSLTSPNRPTKARKGALSGGQRPAIQTKLERNPLPSGIEGLLAFSMDAVSSNVGVNPFFMGQVQDLRRTPASSVQAIQRQAGIVLAPLMDSLRLYRKEHGRTVVQFVQEFYDVQRVARILRPSLKQVSPMVLDTDIFEYDVVVSEAPTTPNAQTEFWESFTNSQFLPYMMQVGMPIPPEIFDYAPLPPAVAARFKQAAEMVWAQMQSAAASPQQSQPAAREQ